MPDGTENGQGLPVDLALPTLAASDNPAVAQPSTPQLSEAQLDAMIDRRLRSVKDKRLKILDDLGGVEVLEQYVKANGGDVRKAAREIQLDALLDKPSEQPAPIQPAAIPGRVAAPDADRAALAERTISILNDAGIPTNDPDYLALTKKSFANEGTFLHELASFAVKRARAAAPANPAASATAGGGGVPGSTDKGQKRDQLTTRLRELLKSPSANAAEIVKVQGELKTLL